MEELEKEIIVKFNDEELTIVKNIYAIGNATRLDLVDKEGMPCLTVTTNVEHIELNEGEILVKEYTENRGILKALKQAGVIENITEKVSQGYDYVHICKLLI